MFSQCLTNKTIYQKSGTTRQGHYKQCITCYGINLLLLLFNLFVFYTYNTFFHINRQPV